MFATRDRMLATVKSRLAPSSSWNPFAVVAVTRGFTYTVPVVAVIVHMKFAPKLYVVFEDAIVAFATLAVDDTRNSGMTALIFGNIGLLYINGASFKRKEPRGAIPPRSWVRLNLPVFKPIRDIVKSAVNLMDCVTALRYYCV